MGTVAETDWAPTAEEINRLEKAAWDENVDHVLVWERDQKNNLGYFVKGWLDLEIEDASRHTKEEVIASLVGLRDQVLERLKAEGSGSIRKDFDRIRRTRSCYRCGAPPEHCECPDAYEQ